MKRPKAENIPSPRKLCQYCHQPLKYWTDDTLAGFPPDSTPAERQTSALYRASRVITRRVFKLWRGYPAYNPLFCTLNHALQFAIAAHVAGYRIVRKDTQ